MWQRQWSVWALAGLLSACGGGGGGSTGQATGQISLGITDGPVEEASAVVISFDAIELHNSNGQNELINLDPAVTLDLLSYQGLQRAPLLDDYTLPAGDYTWLRLSVDEAASYIEIQGQQYALTIPSSAQTGLKLNRGITVGAGSQSDFTVEFDLRQSVHRQGNGRYTLRPTLRLVDNLEVATLSGTVDEALIIDPACHNGDNNDMGNSVYLFSGTGATVQDLRWSETDETVAAGNPLTTAAVDYDADSGTYRFTLAYLPLGDYTLAFTCDGSLDEPNQQDDAVLFPAVQDVTVVAGGSSVHVSAPVQ